jgi:hypothetical protein
MKQDEAGSSALDDRRMPELNLHGKNTLVWNDAPGQLRRQQIWSKDEEWSRLVRPTLGLISHFYIGI